MVVLLKQFPNIYNIIFEWRRAPPTRAWRPMRSSGPPSRVPGYGSATTPPATATSTTSTATGSGRRRAVDLEPAQQQRGPRPFLFRLIGDENEETIGNLLDALDEGLAAI